MNTYLTFKALHLIAVISWMAGLLYLPRIFVYHAETDKHEVKETFKIMERRLFIFIMNPGNDFIVVIRVCFIAFSWYRKSLKEIWLIAKIVLVLSLTFYHFFLFNCLRNFSIEKNEHSSKFLEL